MIRIKHDGKCRKIAQAPKTMEDLKVKITELFGGSAAKFEITYKDCDGELVSIVDAEDLRNCIEEAELNKMTCVTLLLKEGGRAARSISSKKRSQAITESDSKDVNTSEEENGFKVVGKTDSSEDEKVQVKLLKEKAKAEAELLKKKLLEEHQKALEQLEAETNTKLQKLHHKKHHSVDKGCKQNAMMKQRRFMMKMRVLNQFCNSQNIENPMMTTKNIFKSLNEEFPQLAFNPALLNLVLNDASEAIRNTLKQSCQKIVSQNPELAKAGEQNKPKFEELKDKVKEQFAGPHHQHRRERNGSESTDRDARRAAKLAMVAEMKDRKKSEREAHKLQKEAEKAERQARKAEEKQNKGPSNDEEKAVKAKVHALKDIFTNARKHHLRAIVDQNPSLSVLELVPLIKAAKIGKSH